MLKKIYTLITILIFTGCAVKQPYITEYKMEIESFPENNSAKMCSNKTIKVIQSFANNTLSSTKMSYIIGKHKQFFFTKA